jgi:hypothetical protein
MNTAGQRLGPASEQQQGVDRSQKMWTSSTFATVVNTKIIILPSDEDTPRDCHQRLHRQINVGRDASDQGAELVLHFPFVDKDS